MVQTTMNKYKIYFRIKGVGDAESMKLEANLNAETFGKACDELREEVKVSGISAEQIVIIEGFQQVYSTSEVIVLPEDM